ncbi:DEAD/DEAH box helicase family protein [Zunongwangia sp. F260]|uniref:DEAD/DEAH box helicase family protein n=1 Tax=Autumnicola lenta TaxID=3075593 RepID=A0ABU3CJN9_9FLAO|nr:DEAD/DEAH box helicase family protein [Zunongwangia sp. F260]MDT0646569.1 DEAD/DEAH box helicase family protein [Zunongwangia sp. F260]
MKHIAYQQEYKDKISATAVELLNDEYREQGAIVFKAPTGSGKTYMISQALTKIVKEQATKSYSFIWLSVNSLHEQSRESLTRYLEDEKLLDCITIDDLQNNVIEENEIVFINWDSLIKKNNSFRLENELDWNLHSVVQNTKEEGREIILIIDESHRTASTDKAKEVIEEVNPTLIVEMTATPSNINGTLIDIPLAKVIAQGMIKSEVRINPNSKSIRENKDLLEVALKKRKQLKHFYEKEGTDINPLLLIQIPNKKQTDSSNPEDYIIGLLADHSITIANGNLEIRISGVDIKELDEKVKPGNSPIDVLIFKEAIALGWDCPRASLIFLQREWKQERYSFNIQTLGRIMRMPEQKHYITHPELNYGYIYSASDNFEIVQELANNYVSDLPMERDENINTKPIKLTSEFIRRKRELTRLSGAFRKCLLDSAKELDTKSEINPNIKEIHKNVGLEGVVKGIDKDSKQEVEFSDSKSIRKDINDIASSYTDFCAEMAKPYSIARSVLVIKSSIRTWFKHAYNIGDEDKIALIVMNRSNNPRIRKLLEQAKDLYANLPTREDEVVSNPDWEIPESISIFTDYAIVENSYKSIIKNYNDQKLYVKKNKNGKINFSQPEIDFIEEVDKTDDDILWWFKNGERESRYFGIAYKKTNGFYYGFYPDFIIKTKKETIIVEIKDDNDLKPENALKLQAGKNYITRANNKEKVRFYMLSPMDYATFFTALKDQDIESFESSFEKRLIKYNQSQKKLIESKIDQSEKEKENLEWLSDFEKTIDELNDEKFKRELLEMQLSEAQENIETLARSLNEIQPTYTVKRTLTIEKPFNICVLGEVSDQALIRKQLNNYFEKVGLSATDWKIEFFNNTKLQNTNVLRSLQKGQSKFSLIVTGQIFHHSGKGNAKANIISELKNEKYIPHSIGSNPKDLLTPDKILITIDNYLEQSQR